MPRPKVGSGRPQKKQRSTPEYGWAGAAAASALMPAPPVPVTSLQMGGAQIPADDITLHVCLQLLCGHNTSIGERPAHLAADIKPFMVMLFLETPKSNRTASKWDRRSGQIKIDR